MSRLLPLFADNILPIFLAAGAGFLIAKYLGVAARPVSQVSFYIFSPALLFRLLTTSNLTSTDIARMGGFNIATTLALGAAMLLLALLLRFDRRMIAALVLVTMFNNSGNFGLSLNLFAFGEAGLAHASAYFATMVVLTYTLGVLTASLGRSSLKEALLGLLRIPAVYAMLLALLTNTLHLKLPVAIDRTVLTLSNGAIPMLLVVMGIQLRQARWNGKLLALGIANVMRLLVSPLLALLAAPWFGLQGVAFQAAVTESAMPTAVLMTVLATEYDLEPAFVTSVVISTTLLSPLTLTPLLAYLGA